MPVRLDDAAHTMLAGLSLLSDLTAVPMNSAGPVLNCSCTLQGNGNVVRLVGLYHCNRGAHTFFLKMKEVARPGGYVVNLIHYEDAARLAMSVSTPWLLAALLAAASDTCGPAAHPHVPMIAEPG